jgi:N-terminal acetyltransferase B complex catalytic subunit
LRFNNVNLDAYTETYNLGFYLQYLVTWPEYNYVVDSIGSRVVGYLYGKAEGPGEKWHGHVTAITVGPEFRRYGVARKLMNLCELVSEKIHNAYFVDLFVRKSNSVAINMYKTLGYSVYRTVTNYYSGEEDAFDMRKALPRDVDKKSIKPLDRAVSPYELDETL